MITFALILAVASFLCSVTALVLFGKALELAQQAHHRCDSYSEALSLQFEDKRQDFVVNDRRHTAACNSLVAHDHILTAHDKILQDIQSELVEFKNDVVLTHLIEKTK